MVVDGDVFKLDVYPRELMSSNGVNVVPGEHKEFVGGENCQTFNPLKPEGYYAVEAVTNSGTKFFTSNGKVWNEATSMADALEKSGFNDVGFSEEEHDGDDEDEHPDPPKKTKKKKKKGSKS